MIGKRVEYQTGLGCYGIGIITKVNEKTGMVTVKDDEDACLWQGDADQVVMWDEEVI